MRMDSGEALPRTQTLSWINLFANSADQIATVALPVIYVSQFGGDARANSILTVAATLPILLFSLPLGALADRTQLRSVLLGGELLRLLSLMALMLVLRLDAPSLFLLAALAMLGGIGTVAFQVAAPSMVARTTSGAVRARLNGSIELSRSIAVTAGPPAAGIIISLAGGSMAFAVAVAMVAVAVLAIFRLPKLDVFHTESTSLVRRLQEGLQFTLRNPWLKPILLVSLGFNLGWYMLLGVIVAWASNQIPLTSSGIGIMFACYGVGMITGASFVKRFAGRIRQERLVRIGPYCGLIFAMLIALSSYWPNAWILYLAFFLIGVGPIIWTITTVGIRQAVTPHHLIGRVSATNMTLSAGARPLGAVLGYVFFGIGGYPAVFAIAVIVFGMQAIAIGRTTLAKDQASPGYAEVAESPKTSSAPGR